MIRLFQVSILAICCAVCLPSASAIEAPVRLEVRTEPGFPIAGHQPWVAFLSDFGFTGVTLRSARPGDRPSITTGGTANAPQYRVVGILTEANRLMLPGLTIRSGQRRELTEWLQQLRRQGAETMSAPKGAFGLTEKQLRSVQEQLQPKVTFATRDQLAKQIVQRLIAVLAFPVEFDAEARRLLSDKVSLVNELQGVSRGTALAAALRSLGLEFVPESRPQGQVAFRVRKSQSSDESWPVGFRPEGKSPGEIAPAAFEFLEVEIRETPLHETLMALESRLNMPILLDLESMSRHGIDANAPVSLPKTKTFYKKIIDRLLFQAKLRCEFRIDEGGHVFIWVTSIRK